jgi:hypothetical protein
MEKTDSTFAQIGPEPLGTRIAKFFKGQGANGVADESGFQD